MVYDIQTSNLNKNFGTQKILKSINLNVEKGKIYALIGANGAGKTTLMKMMLGLLQPTRGKMTVLASDVRAQEKNYLAKVGNLIEIPVFYQNLIVRENLDIHCDYLDEKYKVNIHETLALVGLNNIEDKFIKELSLGMKQRLAIARSLLCQPELLILDEPINGIDPEGIVEIRNILVKINQERNVTIFLSSHIIQEVEKIGDVVGIMSVGKLLEEIPKAVFQKDNFDLEDYFIKILHTSKIA